MNRHRLIWDKESLLQSISENTPRWITKSFQSSIQIDIQWKVPFFDNVLVMPDTLIPSMGSHIVQHKLSSNLTKNNNKNVSTQFIKSSTPLRLPLSIFLCFCICSCCTRFLLMGMAFSVIFILFALNFTYLLFSLYYNDCILQIYFGMPTYIHLYYPHSLLY